MAHAEEVSLVAEHQASRLDIGLIGELNVPVADILVEERYAVQICKSVFSLRNQFPPK